MLEIRVQPDPMRPERTKTHSKVYRHQRLRTILLQYAGQYNRTNVWVNGKWIDPPNRSSVRLKDGDKVLITPRLSAGVGAALANIGAWLASGTFAAKLAVYAIYTAISYGISYALAPNAPGSRPGPKATPGGSNDLGFGQQTTQAFGIVKPLCFGTLRLHGNIIGVYTDVSGGKEVRHLKIGFGYNQVWGDPDTDTLKINNQPSANFTSVTTEFRNGTVDQTAMTDWQDQPIDYAVSKQVEYGTPVVATTAYSNFDSIRGILRWRARYIDGAGNYLNQTFGIKIEISEAGAGVWSTLMEDDFTNDTDDLQFFKFDSEVNYTGGSPVTVTNGTAYDVRVTMQKETTLPAQELMDLEFAYLQEVHAVAFTHPGQPLLAVRASDARELSGAPTSISLEWETAVLEQYDALGVASYSYSNDPAWVIWNVLVRPTLLGDGGGTPFSVYEYQGDTPSGIGNLSEFLSQLLILSARAAEQVNDGRGGTVNRYTFNGKIDSQTNIWNLVQRVAQSCDCEIARIGTGYQLYIDAPDADVEGLWSAGNIIPGTYQIAEVPNKDKAGRFEMTIQDEDRDYEEMPIPWYGQLQGSALKPYTISGFGITQTAQARRKEYRLAQHNDLVNFVCEFQVGLDALSLKRNTVIYLVDPERRDGLVKSASSNVIELDKAPATSETDYLALRTHDNSTGSDTVEAILVSSVSGAFVTLASTPTVLPKPQFTVYAFGPEAVVKKLWRVKGITAKRSDKGDTTFQVRCEEYFAALYPADGFDPNISWSTYSGVALVGAARPLTQVDIDRSVSPGVQVNPWIGSSMPATEVDPVVGAVNGIVQADGAGNISAATAGVDYVDTEVDPIVGAVNGIVKADGAGNISAAVAGTDYALTHAETTGKTTDDHHAQVHTIVSHDTTATGANLTTLTDDSLDDTLHRHAELSGSDGTPNPAVQVDADGNVGISEPAPETLLEMTHATPYITTHNETHEDTEGGGESKWIGKREQSGGEESAAGQIEISHNGVGDDQLGKMILSVNTGPGLADVIKVASPGITFIGDAGVTNYAELGINGALTLHGTARVKKEFGLILSDFNPGASGPTKALHDIFPTYEFTIADDMHTSFELPTDWETGTDITVEVYWAIDEAYVTNSGEVQWSADWRAVAVGEVISGGASGTMDFGDVNIPATANTVVKTTSTISGASLAADDLIAFNGARVALDGGANPTAEPYIIAVRLEYTVDKLGESL